MFTCQDRRDSWRPNPKSLSPLSLWKIQRTQQKPKFKVGEKWVYIYRQETEPDIEGPLCLTSQYCQSVISLRLSLFPAIREKEWEMEGLHSPTCLVLTWMIPPICSILFLFYFFFLNKYIITYQKTFIT